MMNVSSAEGRRAPVGRFVALMYRLPAVENQSVSTAVRQALPGDLERLSPLLAGSVDHAARLRAGDLCLWTEDEEGPVGLVWLNVATHSDDHFGEWTRPTAACGYLNQLLVSPRARGRGLAPLLVRACQHWARGAGLSVVRAAVLRENAPSRRVFDKCGASREGWLLGLRLGSIGTLRLPLRVAGSRVATSTSTSA